MLPTCSGNFEQVSLKEFVRNIKNIDELSIAEKRVFLRLDLNVPLSDENLVADDTRILASLPTIEYALKQNAAVMVCSHLGRPDEGKYDEKYSLAPVRNYLEVCLGRKIKLVRNWSGGSVNIIPGELVILENARFVKGEAATIRKLRKHSLVCLMSTLTMLLQRLIERK